GQVFKTPGVSDIPQEVLLSALKRHLSGDWGDLSEGDKRLNDEAVKDGDRIFSAYHAPDGTKFWVITESDRSATTFLLPDEY
ncbi:MAG: hypothetical protein J6X53_04235, partial [Abditibacteriota bacterium]|nr:hypothetical protein [Abditibacteriota bacterium]